jgi:hypothetical protein
MISNQRTCSSRAAVLAALLSASLSAQAKPLPPGVWDNVDRGAPRFERVESNDAAPPLVKAAALAEPGQAERDPHDGFGDPGVLSFAAGSFAPPAGERVDPELVARVFAPATDGRPEPIVYAFALFERRITPERIAALESAGARVLGFHPEYALRLALRADTLGWLATDSAVRWAGFARPWQKLAPALLERLATASADEDIPLYVSLFESDLGPQSVRETVGSAWTAGGGEPQLGRAAASNPGTRWQSRGWQQRELERAGLVVREYLPNAQALRGSATPAAIARFLALDFAQAIELEPERVLHHDRSTPTIASDYARSYYDGATNAVALAGTIDSGMYIAHEALATHASVGFDTSFENNPWQDSCGHGSHVIGTVLGDPPGANARYAGNAPKLGFSASARFRNVKLYFSAACTNSGASLDTLYSYMRDPWSDGTYTSPQPHVINNSYGSGFTSPPWKGTEAGARTVDTEVWERSQVYVYSMGNDGGQGASSLSVEAAAKNSLAVGNVMPYSTTGGTVGELTGDSSLGPAGDGRFKPNVVAPGALIRSVQTNTASGYVEKWGTSMSAPHVTGVVAQLVDHYSFLRYEPARVHSVLMATATPRSAASIATYSDPHLDTYGAGRVDAFRAGFMTAQSTWANWGFVALPGSAGYDDFTVGAGAERLVVVLHWVETPASALASKALVNDWDLYLDQAPIDPAMNTGEYDAGLSSVDNTEIRYVDNPAPGLWRWKAYPYSTVLNAKMSVTVHVLYGDPTPPVSDSLSISDAYVKVNENSTLTYTASCAETDVNGLLADVLLTGDATKVSMASQLLDGTSFDPLDHAWGLGSFTLGDIPHGLGRFLQWTLRWSQEGVRTFSVDVRNDAGIDHTLSKTVTIDSTAPGLASGLHSTTHTLGAWSKLTSVGMQWTAASDALSGVDGYGLSVSVGGPATPGLFKDLGAVTSTTQSFPESAGLWFNLKTVDRCDNWSASYVSAGPYSIDATLPLAPSNLHSTSHVEWGWSNDASADLAWTAGSDTVSGLEGYSLAVSFSAPSQPDTTKELAAVLTSTVVGLGQSGQGQYVNLRSLDVAGNASSAYDSAGPFYIDTTAPTGVVLGAPATTTVSSFQLAIAASDALSGPWQMRFINDSGAWSPWQSFATSESWDLTAFGGSANKGTRTIRMEVRDAAGNVGNASTTVYYYTAVVDFGAACSGSLGVPTFGSSGIAKPGGALSFSVGNTAALKKALYLGVSKTSWGGVPLPLDLGLFGVPGCALNVSPEFAVPGSGGTAGFTVPVDPAAVGVHGYFQWVLLGDPSGKLVVTTQGKDVVVNPL